MGECCVASQRPLAGTVRQALHTLQDHLQVRACPRMEQPKPKAGLACCN